MFVLSIGHNKAIYEGIHAEVNRLETMQVTMALAQSVMKCTKVVLLFESSHNRCLTYTYFLYLFLNCCAFFQIPRQESSLLIVQP